MYGPLSAIAHTDRQPEAGPCQRAARPRDAGAHARGAGRAGAVDASRVLGHIVFEDVRFSYDASRPILDGISFEAKPGELVALVGLTGAGKTTIASLIPRFFEPTVGPRPHRRR